MIIIANQYFRIPEIGQRGRLVLQLNTTIDSSVHKLPFECRLSFNPDDQIHRKILAMPTYEDNCYVTIESACKFFLQVHFVTSAQPEWISANIASKKRKQTNNG